MKTPLSGIIPPLVTPLASDGAFDEAGMNRLVDHVLAGGVHGLFVLGTTGEAPDLPRGVQEACVQCVCTRVRHHVPVLVGISDTVSGDALSLARTAAACGASGVVATPPYYFNATQAELVRYYTGLADASPLPVYLYNMPSQAKTVIDVETVVDLSRHANIWGLKDSSGNLGYFTSCLHRLRDVPGFSVLMGPEEALGGAVLLGASGGIAGGANLFPKRFVDLYDAATCGAVAAVRSLHAQVMDVSTRIYGIGGGNSGFVRSVKCALSLLGICGDTLAFPRVPFSEDERSRVKAVLEDLGAL